jgi:hypothetical protein
MKGSRLLFLSSWVILLVILAAVAFLSLVSLQRSYSGAQDGLTSSFTLQQIRELGGEDAARAFRGRRATAATWAFGYALLGIAVVLVPYRRGERWAWWAMLVSICLSQLLSLARVLALGTATGTSASATILAVFLIALLAGAPRMFNDHIPALDDK